MKVLDLTGKRFGRLVVLKRVGNASNGKPQWKCVCRCGGIKIVSSSNLRQGGVRSCGCLQSESGLRASKAQRTHGLCGSRLERIWKGMRARCYSKQHPAYKSYGARGITICKEWRAERSRFFAWALTNGYGATLSIDRIDNARGYSPKNCRFVTAKVQANNTRRNRIIEHGGRRLTLSQWATSAGLATRTFWYRLKAGWTMSDALTKPLKGAKT